MKLFALIIFILSNLSFAQIKTSYKWIKSSEKLTSGKCFEVDTETNGNKYIKKIPKDKCKPPETEYVFMPKSGRCYEIDHLTGGEEYVNDVKLKFCRPIETTYFKGIIKDRYDCFMVDAKTKGDIFYERVNSKLCGEIEEQFYWKAKNEMSGDCFVKGKNNQTKKVSTDKCLPTNTIFKFYRLGPKRGECYQQDAKSPLLFSKRANTEKCKPTNSIYIFLKDENKTSGNCYELDEETKGNVYLNRVKLDFCK